MTRKLNKSEIKGQLEKICFVSPFGRLYTVVDNEEYDIENYSKDLDGCHADWDYFDDQGPLSWRDEDDFGNVCVEPEEHKLWRLNHNKKFKTLILVTVVTPKKINDDVYKLDKNEIEKLVNRFEGKIYSLYTEEINR